jgi:hypothetical protein
MITPVYTQMATGREEEGEEDRIAVVDFIIARKFRLFLSRWRRAFGKEGIFGIH